MTPPSRRPARFLLFSAAALAAVFALWTGFAGVRELRSGVAALRVNVGASAQRAAELEAQVAELERELAGARADLTDRSDRAALALEQRLEQADASLERLARELARQNEAIAGVSELQTALESGPLPRRVDEIGRALDEGRTALARAIEEVSAAEREARGRLDDVSRRLDRTRERGALWEELVAPIVQLEGAESVGSAVLLAPTVRDDGRHEAFVLTAWHVVRDIQGDLDPSKASVPARFFGAAGEERVESAQLLRFDAELDVALLRVESDQALPRGAALATRERLARLSVFDPVYAVGCPLGSEPVPSTGEISDADHEIDGQRYFMVNAPTFIGNSGGGVFDAESHALIGIFSKIYNYGAGRPSVVPHMGLATPLGRVYDWLESVGYAHVIGDPPAAVALEAAASHTSR